MVAASGATSCRRSTISASGGSFEKKRLMSIPKARGARESLLEQARLRRLHRADIARPVFLPAASHDPKRPVRKRPL